MSTATMMPTLDLGREIDRRRQELSLLETVQRDTAALSERVGPLGLMITLMPAPKDAGQAAAAVRNVDQEVKRNEKTFGDILHDHFVKNRDVKTITVRDACNILEKAGAKTRSKTNDLYGSVLSMFKQDGRFRKHRGRGSRAVTWGLAAH